MDITGTEQADVYDQTAQGPGQWLTYRGLGGNDTIRMFNGTAVPGAGTDTVEHLIVAAEPWRTMEVGYWDSPAGVVVDLAAGWADDGWGNRDTLIDVSGVHGNGRNDRLLGNAKNNAFFPNGGQDTIDGRDGVDVVGLPWKAGDPTDLSNFNIALSPDAVRGTITSKTDANLRIDITSIERLQFWNGSAQMVFEITDFINARSMAEQGLTGAASQRWNATVAMGTPVTVSFSFVENAPASGPGATGFRSFNAAERQAVRDVLNSTSAVTGLSFTEVAEAGATTGQIRLGVSAQSATKGVAFMPDVSAANATAGDVWMDADSMLALSPGTEGYAALLHELGHALGLRHPRNVDAGDAWAQQLRAADDKTSLTVMSGTASADGLFRADWGLLDVAALQYLYGSKSVNGGDDIYLVGGADALAERTLHDSGGTDTIDATASKVGVSIDLTAARLSSVGATSNGLAPVENLGIAVGTVIENAVGSSFDDVLMGNALANLLRGLGGNDWIDGGAGLDGAVFSGRRADYFVSTGFGKVFVAAQNGVSGFDTLLNVERLIFDDGEVSLTASALAADMKISTDTGVAAQGSLPDPSDQSRSAISYAKSTEAANGTVTVSGAGNFVYTPTAGFAGTDSFGYRVTDAKGGSNVYSAFVTVAQTTQAPQGGTAPVNLTGTAGPDNLVGAVGADTLNGGAGNDTVTGLAGNDTIDGGAGTDTAVYSGNRANYTLVKIGSGFTVTDSTGADGSDTLVNTERLKFVDRGIALDTGATQSAGQAQLLLGAVLGKDLLATKQPLVGVGIDLFDQGFTFQQLSGAIMRLDIWGVLANGGQASATSTQIVNYLLTTVYRVAPDASTLAAVASTITAETGAAQGNFLAQLAESAANQTQVGLVGLAATGLEFAF